MPYKNPHRPENIMMPFCPTFSGLSEHHFCAGPVWAIMLKLKGKAGRSPSGAQARPPGPRGAHLLVVAIEPVGG